MTTNDFSKLLSAAVRPVVCFALVGAFIYTIIVDLSPEATAAVAGAMGFARGYYFRERDKGAP